MWSGTGGSLLHVGALVELVRLRSVSGALCDTLVTPPHVTCLLARIDRRKMQSIHYSPVDREPKEYSGPGNQSNTPQLSDNKWKARQQWLLYKTRHEILWNVMTCPLKNTFSVYSSTGKSQIRSSTTIIKIVPSFWLNLSGFGSSLGS